jgi:hypothetical protein
MEKQLRKRYFEYLVSHYGRMSGSDVKRMLDASITRLVDNKVYPKDVIDKVIGDMVGEGETVAKILAHVDMLDIENRI